MADLGLRVEDFPARVALIEIEAFYESCRYPGHVNPEDRVVVAYTGPAMVGCVRLVVEHGVPVLRGMHVADDRQRMGVGQRLLGHFAQVLDLHGFREAYCIPWAHLASFYGRVGFSVTDEAPPFLRARRDDYRKRYGEMILMKRAGAALY